MRMRLRVRLQTQARVMPKPNSVKMPKKGSPVRCCLQDKRANSASTFLVKSVRLSVTSGPQWRKVPSDQVEHSGLPET